MRTAAILALASLSSIAFVAPASAAASFEKIASTVEADAFAEADDDWRRLMIGRVGACGEFGSNGLRRIDVLIDRYNAIAAAVSANDEAGAMSAGASFSNAVNSNARFSECWQAISRRVGVSSRLSAMF